MEQGIQAEDIIHIKNERLLGCGGGGVFSAKVLDKVI